MSGRSVRSLENHQRMSAQTVLAQKEKYTGQFSDARWAEFVQDVGFFRKRVSFGLWNRMLTDKGYNATPVWTMVSGFIANQVPTRNTSGITWLPWLDVTLALGALGCVWWAFGHRVMLLLLSLLLSHYLTSHFTLKAAFLRLDWVACLIMSVCLIKKDCYRTAGVMIAYATAMRVFPLIFVFGLGAKGLVDFARTRKITPKYFQFFLFFGISLGVLGVMSVLYANGIASWQEFLHKMGVHNSDISGWRVGFKYVFLNTWEGTNGRNLAQLFEDRLQIWWGIQALVLLITFAVTQRLRDHEALAFGYVPVFFLVAPTYYYQVMIAIPFLFFASRLDRPERVIGLLGLFASAIVGHYLYDLWGRGFSLFYIMSCLLFGVVLYMILLAAIQLFRPKQPQPESHAQ